VDPRKVTVLDEQDAAGTIPALRDLAVYLADTGTITLESAQSLQRELDEIEPGFADAVMDPANWGPARATVQAMYRDGVDLSDHAAVDQWITRQNAGLADGGESAGDDAGPLSWDDVDLKEAFGIPDVLGPVRVPREAALAALARTAPLLAGLRDLARRVRETAVRALDVDPLLVRLAVETGLVERDGDMLAAGDDGGWLDDLGTDVAALEAWDYTFAQVLDTTLDVAGVTRPLAGEDPDLTGHGIAMVTDLFLGGKRSTATQLRSTPD
jgi:hypothetical protein